MLETELLKDIFNDVKLARMLPMPVATATTGLACWSSHSMVSPSDL